MMQYDYDLIVIGAGSGGVRASRLASSLGKRVAIIESSQIGGTCVNRGCVPKKIYFHAAQYNSDFYNSSYFGWNFFNKHLESSMEKGLVSSFTS